MSSNIPDLDNNINPFIVGQRVPPEHFIGRKHLIEKEGQGKVAIINYADLEYLEALEDARDSELLRQEVEESKGQPSVTFDELLEELGLNIEI